jgi:hypothetical protein
MPRIASPGSQRAGSVADRLQAISETEVAGGNAELLAWKAGFERSRCAVTIFVVRDGNAWAGGGFAGSSGWFGISVLITAAEVTPPSHLMNGAMRSHNAADQSHLRRPSARCRRQSR